MQAPTQATDSLRLGWELRIRVVAAPACGKLQLRAGVRFRGDAGLALSVVFPPPYAVAMRRMAGDASKGPALTGWVQPLLVGSGGSAAGGVIAALVLNQGAGVVTAVTVVLLGIALGIAVLLRQGQRLRALELNDSRVSGEIERLHGDAREARQELALVEDVAIPAWLNVAIGFARERGWRIVTTRGAMLFTRDDEGLSVQVPLPVPTGTPMVLTQQRLYDTLGIDEAKLRAWWSRQAS